MAAADDLALLRRFEPLIRYTRGEEFFPLRVEPYVAASSLWRQRAGEAAQLIVPGNELTIERLVEPRYDRVPTVYFLRFIEKAELRQLFLHNQRRWLDSTLRFSPGRGRLARVGYGSRLVDLLFSLTLLARGRVPGDTSAAAALEYARILLEEPRFTYYGRVIRDQGWTTLQYWFFYAFNNWRSGFFGVNDHEADWEMINVYLAPDDSGALAPHWVAYASHDFSGDDLRRHWRDPELERVGEHPVIYAGAGSHASYFRPGEYLTEIELPFLAPLVRFGDWARRRWQRLLGELQDDLAGAALSDGFNVFRIPFVDYARGDGVAIGPGQAREWSPALLEPPPAWVTDYRGLWGLYARDPIAGENAPAGPMYNRDGSVRRAWYDPLGWAGLDKVAPPLEGRARLQARKQKLRHEQAALDEEIVSLSQELIELGVVADALEDVAHLQAVQDRKEARMTALADRVTALRGQRAENETVLRALEAHIPRLVAGEVKRLRTHIRRAHQPATLRELRASRLLEFWAAISVGLMMILFVVLVLFYRQHLITGLVAMLSLFIFIESGFRRQLSQLINSVAIGLALVSLGVVVYQFFWPIVISGILITGGFIMLENIRELRR